MAERAKAKSKFSLRSRWLLRLLALYVLAQFGWWAYLLSSQGDDSTVWMILGEGSVFAFLLMLGLVRLDRGLKQDELRLRRDRHFMRAVTHELKTPLSTIQLGVQTLERMNLTEAQKQEVMNGVNSGIDALGNRLDDILVASKLNRDVPVARSSFSWGECVEEAVLRFGEQAPNAQIDVKCDSSDGDMTVMGDKALWRLSMGNLMDNALKHSTGSIHVKWGGDSDKVWFVVQDEGPGIPKSLQAEVIKPFVSLNNDSSGLGLYLAHATAQAHRAKLEMNSSQDGFEVSLVWPLKFA